MHTLLGIKLTLKREFTFYRDVVNYKEMYPIEESYKR